VVSLGYGLDGRGFESQQGQGIFLFTTASRTALGPTQLPIQWVPRALSLGVKRPEREADHSPPPSADVKNACYTSTPQHAFMAWYSVKAHGQLYFYFYILHYVALLRSHLRSQYGAILAFLITGNLKIRRRSRY
jgi:hypothetical protein